MNNFKNFLFYSFAFSTGLLIYTFLIYLVYKIFMEETTEDCATVTTENTETQSSDTKENKKENVNDLFEDDNLEDV